MRLADISLSTRITLLGLLLVMGGWGLWIYNENIRLGNDYLMERENALDGVLHIERSRMQQQVDGLRQDVLFLSMTPPVSAIARATRYGGIDPREGNSRAVWQQRLQNIFSAYLRAHPEYLQARYIGIADGGRELVRVDRVGNSIRATARKSLQRKGTRDYFKAGLKLKVGSVLLSEFDLNQEFGKIEVPHRAMLRAVTPIFDESGKRFGMVVLNLDASRILKPAASSLPADIPFYIADQYGRYLRHPDAKRAFTFDLGRLDDIRQDFPELKDKFMSQGSGCFPLRQLPVGRGGYLAAEKVYFDPEQPQRFLLLAYHLSAQSIAQHPVAITRDSLTKALLWMVVLSGLFMLALRYLLRPLKRITQAAGEIAARKRIPYLQEKVGGEIGELVSALNIMMQKLTHSDAIERENAFRKALIESLPGVFYMIDPQGRFIMCNRNFETVAGGEPGGLVGVHALELFEGEDKARLSKLIQDVFAQGDATTEASLCNAQQVCVPYHFTGHRVIHEHKSMLIGLGLDVSMQHENLRLIESQLRRNQALMRNSMEGIHVMDVAGNVLEVNDAFCRMLGYTQEEALQLDATRLDARSEQAGLRTHFTDLIGRSETFETVFTRKDGSPMDVEVCATGVEIDGRGFVFASSRDITERKKIQAVMQRHHQVIETAMDGYWMTSAEGRLEEANEAYARMSGYSMRELVGMHISQLEASEQMEEVRKHIEKIIADGHDKFETQHRRKDGSLIDIEISATFLAEERKFFVFCHDITERKRIEREIQNLAFYDPLTQIPNRRLFLDRLQAALTVSARQNSCGAVLFLDMDNFKILNDTLGHDYGDLMLIEVAGRIKRCVREMDTVARLGGDEFVVLITSDSHDEQAAGQNVERVAEKIRHALSRPYELKGKRHMSSPSIGVALFRGNEKSVELLLKQADSAMYEAKNAGRNTVRVFREA